MDENKQRNDTVEIDLVPLFKSLVPKIWLMILTGIIVAAIAFGLTKFFITPTYRCSFTAYVNNSHGSESLSQQDINAGKQLVDTYVNIMRSNTILNAAAESVNLDYTYKQLYKMVTAVVQGETEVIAVYVEHPDPQTAYVLANAIANTAPECMSSIVEGSSMKIIDYPMYSDQRYKPNYIKYAVIGFALGVLLIIAITIIRFLANDTIKSDTELESRFSIPILGVIPDVRSAGDSKNTEQYYR